MKRTIEIEDSLNERVESAIEDVSVLLWEYFQENPDEGLPCLHNDLDYSGSVHEIIDSSVPIYTSEIDSIWYLYRSELEQAYDCAGIGDNPLENNGMVAIYCYIEQAVCEWYYDKAEDLWQEWQERREDEESDE